MQIILRNHSLQYPHKPNYHSLILALLQNLALKVLAFTQFDHYYLQLQFKQQVCLFSEYDIIEDLDRFYANTGPESCYFEQVFFENQLFDCLGQVVRVLLGGQVDLLKDFV